MLKVFHKLRRRGISSGLVRFWRSKKRSWRDLLAFAVIVPFLAALVWMAKAAPEQSKAISHAYQVTHVDIATPALSPDGKRMVFEQVIDGKEQLFVMDLNGSNSIQLTRGPFGHESPAWSPDGNKLAVVAHEGDHQIIYIMNADGTEMWPLTAKDGHAIHPNWSPDSSSVIYCSSDDLHPPQKNPAEIYSVNIETKNVVTLISGGINTYPSWSPDGKKIVFRKIIDGDNSEIFVANSDGSNPRNLSNNPGFDGWPSWSPDGREIAFASNRNGNYKIYLMDADGNNVRLLAETQGRATEPRWSSDGKTVYFTNCQKVDEGTDCHIFAANAHF
jgi:TolB protein